MQYWYFILTKDNNWWTTYVDKCVCVIKNKYCFKKFSTLIIWRKFFKSAFEIFVLSYYITYLRRRLIVKWINECFMNELLNVYLRLIIVMNSLTKFKCLRQTINYNVQGKYNSIVFKYIEYITALRWFYSFFIFFCFE